MQKYRVVVFAVILLFLGGPRLLPANPDQHASHARKKPAPQIAFDSEIYDFNIAGPEQTIKHTFRFTNTGSAPLKIERVNTSCDCTAALYPQKIVAPGKQGAIRTTFDPRTYEEKQEEIITVYSNDPLRPQIDLAITGKIMRGVAIVPQGINFGDVHRGLSQKSEVKLLQLSSETMIIHKIEANAKYFLLSTSRFRQKNSRGIKIEVTLKPGSSQGQLSEVITLHTNHKKFPRIDIPVWAMIME